MTSPFNTGPQAPERNPPITPQYYSPRAVVISSITPISQTSTQIVTETENQFVVGQVVRFDIVARVGMQELNQSQAIVFSITNDTTFLAKVDTTKFNAFNPAGNTLQDSMVIPIADLNSGQINSSGRINNITYIDGSFINISPG
jgi:methenyltetrahydromethanopterin cyclohydrolase